MATRFPDSYLREIVQFYPHIVTYVLPNVDFGAGDTNHAVKSPLGANNGIILDVGVMVSEVFNQVTTQGFVRIGTTGDADAYAELQMAAAAATDFFNTRDDTNAIISADVPATPQLEVACIAPTGGTPTGIGDVHITIAWF